MWRYRYLVAAVVLVFAAGGFLIANSLPDSWEATASLVVEDPRNLALFEETPVNRPERYVETQVEIIRSTVVAQRAVTLATDGSPAAPLTAQDLIDDSTVGSSGDSDLIEIRHQADDPEVAIAAVNLIGRAYEEVRQDQAANAFAAALDQLDTSIAASEAEAVALQDEIAALDDTGPRRQELTDQFQGAIATLVRLQTQIAGTPAGDRAELQEQLDDLLQQFQTMQLILAIEAQDPEIDALVTEQRDALDRLSSLKLRRDQMAVDAQLASSGVVLFSPAEEAESAVAAGAARTTAVGVILGGLVGAAIAYFLAIRRRRFTHHSEPEFVLRVPMLAEVPNFRSERIRSLIPVRAAPSSTSAEAFRFVATSMEMLLGALPEQENAPRWDVRSLVVTSAETGDGKTVVTANAALAAAREGSRVLAIDADFGGQGLTRLLRPMVDPTRGLTDVVAGNVQLNTAVEVIGLAEGGRLHLLSRGHNPVSDADFFHADDTAEFFSLVRDVYDLILIDTPPLLHVAYASTVVGSADAAFVVVRHGSPVADLEEVRDRLHLIGTPVAGYIYNGAPIRRELTGSERRVRNRRTSASKR